MTKVNGELRSIAIAIFDADSRTNVAAVPLVFSNTFVYGSVDEVFPDLEMVTSTPRIDDLLKDDYHPSNDFYRAAAWKSTFVLMSVGPDGILNVTEDQVEEAIDQGKISESARLLWSYSPTNGSDSSGDVFRVQY